MAELTKRERGEKRLVGLQAVRRPHEEEWREIASLAQPARSRFLNEQTNKAKAGRMTNRRLMDDYGILSFRTLGNGMTSGLSSSSRPWFLSQTEDPDLMRDHDSAEWLGMLDRQIYALLWRASFYDVAKSGYAEMGLFGTEGGFMESHREKMAVCHSLTAGEFYTATGDDKRPNLMYRRVPMTIIQVVGTFVASQFDRREMDWSKVSRIVKSQYDAGSYDSVCNIFHAVEPNSDIKPGALGRRGMPFSSLWWDQDDGRKDALLREGGYEEQPFWCPRWDTTGSDVYGTGPGAESLPSLRNLQMQAKRKGEGTDAVIKPEKVAPASLKGQVKGIPGNVIWAAAADMDKIQVPYEVDYRVIDVLGSDLEKIERRLDQLSYAELFLAITRMGGGSYKNLEEIASRNQEALTQLGPVIERSGTEKLAIVHARAMGLVLRGNLMPDPPEQLQGQQLKVEFNSTLAQLQRMVGIGQIERSVGFIGNIAGAFPEAADKIDVDGMVDEYLDRAGAPASMRASDEDVKAKRDARAKSQQAAQMAATMPAVRDGADAARLLSETDAGGGQSMLASIAGAGA